MKALILKSIYFGALAWCVLMTALWSIICIVAAFTGGKAMLDFNYNGENIFEAVTFPITSGIAVAGLIKLLRDRW